MKKAVNFIIVLLVVLGCEPKKDPAPDAVLGKAFVELSTPNSNLAIGDTLTVKGNYTNEKNETTIPGFTWSSSKSDIAAINSNGKVTALAVGQTYIIAEFSTKKDTIIITVLPNSTSNNTTSTTTGSSTTSGTNTSTGTTTTGGVSTSTTSGTSAVVYTVILVAQMATMAVNGTQQLQAQIYNSSSNLLSGKSVTWVSSDTSILKVTSTGLITAIKSGTASITATSEGINSIAYAITVNTTMRMGTFSGLGSETCNGTGILKYDAGGNLKIEFSTDFNVTPGPDLYVYLSNVSSGSAVNTKGLTIALLGATSGARSYTVPAGTGINDYKYLVVHCKQYAHTFGNAELK